MKPFFKENKMSFNTHDVAKIEFGIYSPEEIQAMAVCKIDSTDFNGPGTVYDEKMGCIDPNDVCPTCNQKRECGGHFGYIELNEPVLHPLFYKTISAFLKCFCKKCHRLLIQREQIELHGLHKLQGDARFNGISNILHQIDMCSYCSEPQPAIVYKSAENTISMEYKHKKGEMKTSILLNVEDVKKIFGDISDEDVRLLGLDPSRIHPRNLIITNLPVIPSCSRPYVMANGNICDDDLTTQYREIVKLNNRMGEITNENDSTTDQKRQKISQSLKFYISSIMNNSKGRSKHPTDNRPLKGFKERLAGKGGRLRGNLMGKRVDFSARTVIGAEPTLKLGELGIPREVARIHTKPEPVTAFNIEWLTKIVNEGGANFLTTIKKSGGVEKKTRVNLQYALFRKGTELLYGDIILKGLTDAELKSVKKSKVIPESYFKQNKAVNVLTGNERFSEGDKLFRKGELVEDVKYPGKKNITLKIGDVVERHLRNGDVVLFNRQPTLHRGSMLSLRVVILPFKSFRFNLAGNKSWNADKV